MLRVRWYGTQRYGRVLTGVHLGTHGVSPEDGQVEEEGDGGGVDADEEVCDGEGDVGGAGVVKP